MSTRNIMEAIISLQPHAQVHVKSLDDITWFEGDEISKADIQTEIDRLQAEYDAQEYARKRAEDYPSWQEQMDLIYHSGVAGLKTELKKTKDKFPKE